MQIAQFKRALADQEDGLGDVLNLRRMASFTVPRDNGRPLLQDELINFLQFCITGVLSPIAIPPCAMYLDALLGGEELYVGDTPRIGGVTLSVLAIEGFRMRAFRGGCNCCIFALALPAYYVIECSHIHGTEGLQ